MTDDKSSEDEELPEEIDYSGDEYHDDEYHDDLDYSGDELLENPESVDPERGMAFLEHLEEFRWTVGRSLLAFIIGVVLVAFFIDDIAQFLKMPILKAYGSADLVEENLKTYRPMGVVSVFIQIALLGGLTLSMPFVLYFLTCFVAPGLTEQERKVLRPSCVAAFLLFLAGVAFSFYLILPLTMSFFVRLNLYFGFDLFWAASEYYSMVVWFSLATGAFFQFPLIVVILVYLQVVSVEKLKSIRRGVFVGLMVFAAILTPGGDFISLPLTTGFMYGLYELALWVGARIEKKKRAQALAESDES
jgi:sec-independent protein translocase protein TatC